ncbi:hypothetical protein HUG10_05905 [Halorarum halophilum]|uniref:Rhomboid family protein n=1 Tax=Halorarum halophilum TaxID=2743090 RepID=A0A7D5GK91_9EURY|nr:hypothetical protein [Halobaculum halophilum]QLG27107.1 hypothetical protein HUG10_05905 [Halobaculum halophilum]
MTAVEDVSTDPVARGLAGIFGVAALLAAIHFLVPAGVQEQFVFRHAAPNPITFLTAAYLHASDAHLLNNVVGFLIAALYTLGLALAADHRRWFWRAFIATALLVPVLVNATEWVIFTLQYPDVSAVSRGFSGAVAGFAGTLLVALYLFVRSRHGHQVAYLAGLSIFLLLFQLIDLRYAGTVRPLVAGLILLGIGLVAVSTLYEYNTRLRDVAVGREELWTVGAVLFVGVVVAFVVLALFPAPENVVSDGTFVNVYSHAAGFLWGLVIAILISDAGVVKFARSFADSMSRGTLLIIILISEILIFSLSIDLLNASGITLFGVLGIPVRKPVDGTVALLFSIFFLIGYVGAYNRYKLVRTYTKGIARCGWKITARPKRENLTISERRVWDKKEEGYLNTASRRFGTFAFLLILPWILSFLYLGEFNFNAIAAIYVITGILTGRLESGFNRLIVRRNSKKRAESEVVSIISSQQEAFLLILGAATQAGAQFLDTNEFVGLLVVLVLLAILFVIAYILAAKLY